MVDRSLILGDSPLIPRDHSHLDKKYIDVSCLFPFCSYVDILRTHLAEIQKKPDSIDFSGHV